VVDSERATTGTTTTAGKATDSGTTTRTTVESESDATNTVKAAGESSESYATSTTKAARATRQESFGVSAIKQPTRDATGFWGPVSPSTDNASEDLGFPGGVPGEEFPLWKK